MSGIGIVGVGNGGCKIVERLGGAASPGLALVAINTDSRAMAASRVTTKLQIGANRTDGLGTGGDADIGKRSAEDEVPVIKNLLGDMDLVFVVVCLGGGTGSGAAPVVVKAAREAGSTTLCVALLPFKFEGSDQREQADHALATLKGLAHVLMVVPNDRLSDLIGDRSVADTFDKANEVIASSISGIFRLMTQPGYIALDLANIEKAVQDTGGLGTLGYGEGTGKDRVRQTVESLLSGPLVEGGRVISDARSLLVSILGGPDLGLKEVGDVMRAIESKARKDCHLSMGTAIDEALREKLSVVVIASEELAPLVEETASTESAEAAPAAEKVGPGKKKGKSRPEQGQLGLGPADKGRFKGVDPTILDGEDLDIPTYLRRRLNIAR